MFRRKHSTGPPGARVRTSTGRCPGAWGTKPDPHSSPASSVLITPATSPRQAPFPAPAPSDGFLSILPQLFPPLVPWKKPGRCSRRPAHPAVPPVFSRGRAGCSCTTKQLTKEESRASGKAEPAVCLRGFGFAFTRAKVNPHPAVPVLLFSRCANRSRMRAGWRGVGANPTKANTARGAAEQQELAPLRAALGPGAGLQLRGSVGWPPNIPPASIHHKGWATRPVG